MKKNHPQSFNQWIASKAFKKTRTPGVEGCKYQSIEINNITKDGKLRLNKKHLVRRIEKKFCVECGKKLSAYNKSSYCFSCAKKQLF